MRNGREAWEESFGEIGGGSVDGCMIRTHITNRKYVPMLDGRQLLYRNINE